jgi:hypothetical protein
MQNNDRSTLVAALFLAVVLASCCGNPKPPENGGIISISPYTSGPDTMMQFSIGPDTMGATAETLWVMKQDCTLTIKFTGLSTGPDTMGAGTPFRLITRRPARITDKDRQ